MGVLQLRQSKGQLTLEAGRRPGLPGRVPAGVGFPAGNIPEQVVQHRTPLPVFVQQPRGKQQPVDGVSRAAGMCRREFPLLQSVPRYKPVAANSPPGGALQHLPLAELAGNLRGKDKQMIGLIDVSNNYIIVHAAAPTP